MGYRSEVTAVFYAQGVDEWPLLKLFVAENFPKGWVDILEEVHNRDTSGFVFRVSDYKWYDSYPEVQAFREFEERFFALDKCINGAWAWEFVRIGEDYSDIENRCSNHAGYVLSVVRRAEIDF
ncbi:hypothetical protein K0U83_26545 [bacterium]|nr:hypothetical protein [bacterium]